MQGKLVGMALGILLCCWASAGAQNLPPALANSLPQVQYFHKLDAEKALLYLDEVHFEIETSAVRETDPASGRERLIPVEETRQIIERRTYKLANVRTLSLKGDALKLNEVLAKLEPDHPVVVFQQGKKVPATYQKLLRDDVVILEIPVADRGPVVGPPVFSVPSDRRPSLIPGGSSAPTDDRPRLGTRPSLPFAPYVPPTASGVPGRDRF